jgi:acetyl-CoA synthetase
VRETRRVDEPTTAPVTTQESEGTREFRAARALLLAKREDWPAAYRDFRWPAPERFNWATDWFDRLALEQGDVAALRVVEEDGSESNQTFAELSARSQQLAGWLAGQGLRRGDRVLLVLGNQVELWETMLACMRLGAVIIPATTLLSPADIEDRIHRGAARLVLTASADAPRFTAAAQNCTRVAVGPPVDGWQSYADSAMWHGEPAKTGVTRGDDPLLLYFTSGTTAQPKLVEHTHTSYPIGHLSTMYWLGVQPGDVHLNISSPGWAKHAWSSFFAPWNAGATVLVYNYQRFNAAAMVDVIAAQQVTTFCAPPTVWRMLVQEDLASHPVGLRECVAAGEPLNPEVIEQVRRGWGLTVRDGYGQTETTCQVGNPPGQPVKLGSMGRPLPGYVIALVDPVTGEVGSDGEICIELARRPAALTSGYHGDAALTAESVRNGFYHTGDVASRDEDGYITYVGRTDDVFKASDYRISPFELESVLIEHPAIAEAAVVPAPDPVRLAVPKAYITLVSGQQPSREVALEIFGFCRDRLAPYKRIRRLEFAELPKTISGKIRRVELRAAEQERAGHNAGGAVGMAYSEDDFPELTARS